MTQTVFSPENLTIIREEVFEAALSDFATAWHKKDAPNLDRLASWARLVSGPERDSPQAVASVLELFLALQNGMLADINASSFPVPSEIKNVLLDSIGKCKIALGQLERGGANVQ